MKRSFSVTTGPHLRCKGWRQEGLLRLLENVLAVGEDPDNLVVYAALGRAARDWPSHDAMIATLKTMNEGETLIVQSGKPIGVIRTHAKAPLVLMANCNLVGRWAKAETFYELEKKNLICWGGLTAGDWQYIGSQGVIQGTYEIFMGDRRAPFRRRSRRRLRAHRGARRNGRRAAARRHHGQRLHPVHRG
jgi:urocanate hydratase